HCLVAVRRPDPSRPLRIPSWFNRGLDTHVILAEVRQTSRKPDELYEMIERVVGGGVPAQSSTTTGTGRPHRGRKVELFGRRHNLRDGWWTLGNQLGDDDQIFERDVVDRFTQRYPERGVRLSDPKAAALTVRPT
ncbi:hypothetical protein JCM3766R1_001821, partial [Sporobolomyces carnicolor]